MGETAETGERWRTERDRGTGEGKIMPKKFGGGQTGTEETGGHGQMWPERTREGLRGKEEY